MSDQDGDWLTYHELGAQLGVSANAARMHAHRRGWRIGDTARVLVPEEAAVRERITHVLEEFDARPSGPPSPHDHLAQALAVLREHLEHERVRANDAVSAERIASNRAAALEAELDRRWEWSLLRRLKWAIRLR